MAAALSAKVYFATSKADIDAKGREAIAAAATWIKGGTRKVAITGYTDRTSSAEISAELFKRRALAVRAAREAACVVQDCIVMKEPVLGRGRRGRRRRRGEAGRDCGQIGRAGCSRRVPISGDGSLSSGAFGTRYRFPASRPTQYSDQG